MSDDPYDRHRYHNEDTFGIQSTAGAVPVRNKKGEISMQKVKVQRYVSGKRPTFGPQSDSEEDEDFTTQSRDSRKATNEIRIAVPDEEPTGSETQPEDDPRLRRLAARKAQDDDEGEDEDRMQRRRRVHEPEILSDGEDKSSDSDSSGNEAQASGIRGGTQRMELDSDDSSSGDDDLDEEGIQRRRDLMRQRALARAQIGVGQEEIMAKEEEQSVSEDEEETSSEEESEDSEEEEGARLKPVFVRKKVLAIYPYFSTRPSGANVCR